MSLLIGYDVGSSSIKATLMQAQTGQVLATATSPEKELEIIAPKSGWAEQYPHVWWDNLKSATHRIKAQAGFDPCDVGGIGISYQMHGLVAVDKNHQPLRPAIIWCDSRAVEVGQQAAQALGEEKCLKRLLNLPGNFTAARLKWVMDNEPDIYSKIHKIMLPGDYIAMKLTGEITTTASGLSEAVLWDFKSEQLAQFALDYFGFSSEIIPDIVPTFGVAGQLTKRAAEELGLKEGTKVSYRAGDQPNNALSLNVLDPGEIAATAGTSGVIYGIGDKPNYDAKSRVNTFIHVNNKPGRKRYGVLLCISGTGILNSWLKHNTMNGKDYEQMNELASKAPVGCNGLIILPFGNGAERTLENKDIGASVHGWNFNIHKKAHVLRAAQEGIVFALNFGLAIFKRIGIEPTTVRAGAANMFLSPLFSEVFAAVTKTTVELYNTDGSQGAARGAGIGAGIYKGADDAFVGLKPIKTIEPNKELTPVYNEAYKRWENTLRHELKRSR